MARGGNDSEEERHDRFRSERNTTSLSGSVPKRISMNLSRQDDRRIRDRRRSHERERSRSRRSRERSLDRKRRKNEDIASRKRKSSSKEREPRTNKKHRDKRSPSRDKLKSDLRSRDRSSSDRKSDSYSSHDSRTDQKSFKHSRKSRETDYNTAISRVDTFAHKFERRRDSSVEEEVVDNNVVYRDSSASPEPSKHKKKKNGEKEKKKEKRKEKKKKKKSKSLEKCDESQISGAVSILPEKMSEEGNNIIRSNSPPVDDKLLVEEDLGLKDLYGPMIPPKTDQKSVGPVVPSSSPEESLPGNRSTLHESSPLQAKDIYGPLPPTNFKRKSTGEETDSTKDPSPAEPEPIPTASGEGEVEDQKDIGRVYGPVLPLRAPVAEMNEDDASYGPALPPRLLKPQPVELDDEEDDGGYGPLPAGLGGRTQEELEIRAALIKRQLGNKELEDRPKKREDWMIELPDARRAEFGLGPRKFRAREGPDMSDRSSWTDTPEEKKKREELSRLGVVTRDDEDDNTNSKMMGIIARDKEMEKKARERKKDKSLLDIHQKELKKKKKKEEKERGSKEEERRPFSREIDLQTNKFDEAQKKSIIKKAQLLDSRFSRGESKFL